MPWSAPRRPRARRTAPPSCPPSVDHGAVRIILTAGAPDAGTDDVGRLVLAARKVAATDCELPVRVGVHRGRAFAA